MFEELLNVAGAALPAKVAATLYRMRIEHNRAKERKAIDARIEQHEEMIMRVSLATDGWSRAAEIARSWLLEYRFRSLYGPKLAERTRLENEIELLLKRGDSVPISLQEACENCWNECQRLLRIGISLNEMPEGTVIAKYVGELRVILDGLKAERAAV